MTDEEHNKYLAWAFLGHGAFQALIMLAMFVIFAVALVAPGDPAEAGIIMAIFGFMFVLQTLFVVPSIIAAYALFKRKSWARIASIVAGILAAMNVPFGTVACVYTLWFFLGDRWKNVYAGAEVPAAEVTTRQLSHEREARWTGYTTNEKGEVSFHPVEPPDWR